MKTSVFDCIAAWNRRALSSRAEVLEEAAKVADDYASRDYNGCEDLASDVAAAIRALKKDTDNG